MPRWASLFLPPGQGSLAPGSFPERGEAELSPDDGCLLPCWGWRASLASSCFPSGSCHIPSLGGGQGEDTTPHLGTGQAPGLLIQETGNPALQPGPSQVPHLPSPENNAGATWGQCQEGPREQNGAGCRQGGAADPTSLPLPQFLWEGVEWQVSPRSGR